MTPDEENKLIEIASRWEWMCDLLDGKEVSDFALSFPEVQKLDDVMSIGKKLIVSHQRKDKAMPEEKLYIGSKLITALPLDECSFLKKYKGADVTNRETREGYKVTYPDGYVSWSPKETFEIAYRELTDAEKGLI